jgi:shikimate dehydrogenase
MANKIYGLIGAKLGHSFSKDFFSKKFAKEDISAEYRNFEIDNIEKFSDIIEYGVYGLNITIPYKEQVIDFLDKIDPIAAKIGAVNVVKIVRNADNLETIGYNSDIVGFTESIRPLIENHHKKALILGTGGASKAVIEGLKLMNIRSQLVSRTKSPNTITYSELSSNLLEEYTIIVNTTPLGMFPNTDSYPDIPYEFLSNKHLCYDLTYNPEETRFLKLSRDNGAKTKNGLEMLILQALESWRIWNM